MTTFAWDAGADWPAGTTVELCSNGACADGITTTQHTLLVPIQPGEKFDARARAIPPLGYQCGEPLADCPPSKWATVQATWPALPIGGWARYERQGTTPMANEFLDSSGNGNHGSAYGGATTTTTSVSGLALLCDGVDDYVTVPSFASSPTDVTYSYWIYFPNNPSDWGRIFVTANYNADPSVGVSHVTFFDDPGVRIFTRHNFFNGTQELVLPGTGLNTWFHIVHTASGNNMSVYLNGSLSYTDSGTRGIGSAPVTIGAGGDPAYVNAYFDEVRIYNRVLTSDEVATLYNTPTATLASGGLLMRLSFDVATSLSPIRANHFAHMLVR